MKKLRLFFTYWKQLGKIITMKMNRIIPVIVVIVVLVTGSLVNAYSLNTSGKLRLDSKKNFLASSAESTPGNTSDNSIFESYKGAIASSDVIRMDAYNGSTITPYYFHTNAIGSTTAVTDANGQVVERYKYGLYGMPTFMDAAGNVIPKSTIRNNILFHGKEYEPEMNFYYFRARHLDPIMGRFLQTDPMGYEDSLNLYQALNMNPVNFVDPMGRNRKSIEVQKQSEISALESRLYELELSISFVNDPFERVGVYGEYLKLNEIYKQKTGKYFIRKKAGEPIMTPREAFAIVMGFTPAGDADDITLLLANYSILEGKKVKLNLLGKGVATLGAILPFIKTKHLLKVAKLLGLEKFLLKVQKKISTKIGRLKERFKGKVALDTNALILALEGGELAAIERAIAGRTPIISITAAKEFLKKGDITVLRKFLKERGERIGKAATELQIEDLMTQAHIIGRVLRYKDAAITASAISEVVTIITRDQRFKKFLEEVGIIVEEF